MGRAWHFRKKTAGSEKTPCLNLFSVQWLMSYVFCFGVVFCVDECLRCIVIHCIKYFTFELYVSTVPTGLLYDLYAWLLGTVALNSGP